ncbi:CRISPR-associated helicase Cas3' [Thermosynechococcus sp. TG215]|uniref:CRISPR-associated helicase Cas3' n=1 Tax=Thermosynechococcus sp. TG215 TaxID=3074095 RepID=UPI002877FAC8|nr:MULTISPECIES: CRISPR-associated helicase Cas3' [unclassified Thermosynechococcus]WNC53999.1 CRISPR-associated helicase Cas3' [Thermosynechococcus sp. TG215]
MSNYYAHTPNQDGQWHSLSAHLSKVAGRASKLAGKLGTPQLGNYGGLWHDLGKYNPDFQAYLQACTQNQAVKEKVPHAKYGALLAFQKCQPLAPMIYGHHSGLPNMADLQNRLAEVDRVTYEHIKGLAKADGIDLDPSADFQKELTSIASPELDIATRKLNTELFLRLLFSCLVDADYLDTESHFDPTAAAQRGQYPCLQQLWSAFAANQTQLMANSLNTPVNTVRKDVYHHCLTAAKEPQGVFRLAVPTGGGKTRSSLAFALQHALTHGLDRVIVAVPYTSIIEQTVAVYREILGEDTVLEHHSAVQTDFQNEDDARSLQACARLAAQNWDAPLIVTTTVQLFESLFANRPSRCRKLHNIVNSVIILDEVQTLPLKLLAPILSVLKTLVARYRVTVVLCTATQPALAGTTPYLEGFDNVRDIIPPEEAQQQFCTLKRVNYEQLPILWSWQDLVADLKQQHQALVVVNTRKDALAILDALGEEERDRQFHLSTLLYGAHRQAVLQEVRDRLRNNQPCWLISTQVVEAGVDLDFPVVYRAMGSLDRIVQAAGRCNREGQRSSLGRVVIFDPQEGRTPQGEYCTAVETTRTLLRQAMVDLNDPTVFQRYFQQLYQVHDLDTEKIQQYRQAFNFPEVAQRFRLIEDHTYPVVIVPDQAKNKDEHNQVKQLIRRIQQRGLRAKEIRALQPYLVNLRTKEFHDTEHLRELIAAGLWAWQGDYDPLKGIAIATSPIVADPSDLIF